MVFRCDHKTITVHTDGDFTASNASADVVDSLARAWHMLGGAVEYACAMHMNALLVLQKYHCEGRDMCKCTKAAGNR